MMLSSFVSHIKYRDVTRLLLSEFHSKAELTSMGEMSPCVGVIRIQVVMTSPL